MVQSNRILTTNRILMKVGRYIAILICTSVVASCLKLQTNGEYDSNGDYWGGYTLNEWLVSERNLNCHIFAEAVAMTGMDAIFETLEPSTVIVPNDVAFMQLFSEMGISSIGEFEPIVLKEILSYLVMSQPYISTEIADGAIIAAQNLSEKPIYISNRYTLGNTDQLYINNHLPEGVKNFASTKATVVMQDVIFKDHVAQIVSNVPYHKVYTIKTDTYGGMPNTNQIFQIDTEADTYLFNKMLTSRADYPVLCNSERIPIILYKGYDSIDFYDEISVAKVSFYIAKVEGFPMNPFVLYDITDQAWELTRQGNDLSGFYNALRKDYLPEIAPANKVATFDFSLENERWTSVDITNYILEHYKEPSPKPIAFTVVPANTFYSSVGILQLGYKKESTGDIHDKPSYIQVLGRMDSRIQLKNNENLKCNESIVITRDKLLCSAPVVPDGLVYSPQNITYRIVSAPSAGVLTRHTLPLRAGDVFTQNEINEGAIAYYKTSEGISDEFTLKAGDYSGASLPEHIVMTVSLQ